MRLLYVDESGDEQHESSDRFFVFGGIAVADHRWHELREKLEGAIHPLINKHELHASDLIGARNAFHYLHRGSRARDLYTKLVDVLVPKLLGVSVFIVILDKQGFPITFDARFVAAMQLRKAFREHITRIQGESPSMQKATIACQEYGLVICDKHKKEREFQRLYDVLHSEQVGNPANHRLVETALFMDSRRSRMIQVADLICHIFFQAAARGEQSFLHRVASLLVGSGNSPHVPLTSGFQYIAAAPPPDPLPFGNGVPVDPKTNLPSGCYVPVEKIDPMRAADRA